VWKRWRLRGGEDEEEEEEDEEEKEHWWRKLARPPLLIRGGCGWPPIIVCGLEVGEGGLGKKVSYEMCLA
jgi:hypothetical protein